MASQPQYFFYEPDHHKGHLAHHHMAVGMHQLPFYSMVPSLPQMHMMPMHPVSSTPVYTRPNSACSQPAMSHQLYSTGPTVLTPAPSPRPTMRAVNKAPKKLTTVAKSHVGNLDADASSPCDSPYLPATPPLSCSGSVGSPSGCDALQTPMNPMFSGLDGFKDSFDIADNLSIDWSTCTSPQLTPVYLQAQAKTSPLNTCSTGSPVISCPSLSPSPSPHARPMSSKPDANFCNPRDLTVTSAASSNGYPITQGLPATADLAEEDVKIAPIPIAPVPFALNESLSHLTAFEDASDLDSEEDFTRQLAIIDGSNKTTVDIRRPRACTGSSVVSLGRASIFSDDDLSFDENDNFSFSHLPSPPSSNSSFSDDDSHQDKRARTSRNSYMAVPVMNCATDTSGSTNQSSNQDASETKDSSASASGSTSASPSDSTSGSESIEAPLPTPVNRRGRKQSLTEDPSKTFVCDLCHRRFRRQEHLKRHYRSLHTHEKPFECHECGKKFSRSDNLAQHARTHGSGAIVMDLINDCSGHSFNPVPLGAPADYHSFGKVLFHMTADMSGSSSDHSSEDNAGDHGRKKRRRAD